MRLLIIPVLLSLVGMQTCNTSAPGSKQTPDWPSREDLVQSVRSIGKVLFIYGALDAEKKSTYREFIEKVNQNERFRYEVAVKEADAVERKDLEEQVVILIGTFDTTQLIGQLLNELPYCYAEDAIQFNGEWYKGAGHVLKMGLYPNPLNPKLPIYLVTGTSDAAVQELLFAQYGEDWSRLLRRSWGYELYEKDQVRMLGYFSDTTWRMNKEIHFEFFGEGELLLKTDHFSFFSADRSVEHARLEAVARACETGYNAICSYVGQNEADYHINYRIHTTFEEKGLQYNNTNQAHIDWSKQEVHALINEHFQGHQLHLENALLLRHLLGEPKSLALELGLALQFAPDWYWRGVNYWAGRLYVSGNLPPLAEAFDAELLKQESNLVFQPLAYLVVSFLQEKWGREGFLERYANWQPTATELKAMDQDWRFFLENRFTDAAAFQYFEGSDRDNKFLKGFNFAHEGYRVYNGYGSKLARQSLQKLKGLGTNALAIVPYSFMRDPKVPSFLPVMSSPGGENDESVVFAHAEAQKMGMYTLLKPQVWIRGSWPGDVEMQSKEAWEQFFDYYYRWMRHYAMLAELYQFDGFCVGVEFTKATLGFEKEWRDMVSKVRGIYSGHLTYAANWGAEFEQLAFWDAFDYIGLNCYYPLSELDEPKKEELEARFAQILAKAEKVSQKFDRPLVFTEIGFRSVQAPWKNPHAEAANRPFNAHHQELCYEVVFEGLSECGSCSGIFWWKWPSYLEYQGAENESFTPNRKLAEQTIKKWFAGPDR